MHHDLRHRPKLPCSVTGRDGQLSLAESRRLPSPEDVVQSAETGTDALSAAEEEQNLAERPEDELEAMQVCCRTCPSSALAKCTCCDVPSFSAALVQACGWS